MLRFDKATYFSLFKFILSERLSDRLRTFLVNPFSECQEYMICHI